MRLKAKYICHILGRNCLLKRVTEGKIEELRRRGRWLKQSLDDHNEKKRFLNLREEPLYLSLWTTLLQESMDLSQDKLRNEQTMCCKFSYRHCTEV